MSDKPETTDEHLRIALSMLARTWSSYARSADSMMHANIGLLLHGLVLLLHENAEAAIEESADRCAVIVRKHISKELGCDG